MSVKKLRKYVNLVGTGSVSKAGRKSAKKSRSRRAGSVKGKSRTVGRSAR